MNAVAVWLFALPEPVSVQVTPRFAGSPLTLASISSVAPCSTSVVPAGEDSWMPTPTPTALLVVWWPQAAMSTAQPSAGISLAPRRRTARIRKIAGMRKPLRQPRPARCLDESDVEPKVHDVAFADEVVLALEAHLSRIPSARLPAAGDVVVEADDLGADEAALEVGVDHAGRLRRGRTTPDRPGADLLRAGGEVGLQPEQAIGAANHPVQTRLIKPEFLQEVGAVGVLELGDLGLDRGAHGDHLRALPGRQALDGRQQRVVAKATRGGVPLLSASRTRRNTSRARMASLSPLLAALSARCRPRSAVSRSASASSVLMISISASGSTRPATCTTSSFSKQRTTCAIASTSRMLARNLFPRPSPCEAPFTMPAMSTNSTVVGTTFSGCAMSASCPRRGSGTGTTPTFGSIVQKG